jgi:hypothetical protein
VVFILVVKSVLYPPSSIQIPFARAEIEAEGQVTHYGKNLVFVHQTLVTKLGADYSGSLVLSLSL